MDKIDRLIKTTSSLAHERDRKEDIIQRQANDIRRFRDTIADKNDQIDYLRFQLEGASKLDIIE